MKYAARQREHKRCKISIDNDGASINVNDATGNEQLSAVGLPGENLASNQFDFNAGPSVELLAADTVVEIDSQCPIEYSETTDEDTTQSYPDKLKLWSIRNCISRKATTEILKILHPLCDSLPLSAATLLKTANTCTTIKKVFDGGGEYLYFGLRDQLIRRINHGINESFIIQLKQLSERYNALTSLADDNNAGLITLKVSTDGIPLQKSTNKQLWPISVIINECVDQMPILVASYIGDSKPSSADILFSDFCDEIIQLKQEGLMVDGNKYCIHLYCLICDAPARAFCKGCKQHGGYNACEFCDVRGTFNINNNSRKVVYLSVDSNPRTDEKFKNFEEIGHQLTESPLTNVLPMVSCIPPEYMHLVRLTIIPMI